MKIRAFSSVLQNFVLTVLTIRMIGGMYWLRHAFVCISKESVAEYMQHMHIFTSSRCNKDLLKM